MTEAGRFLWPSSHPSLLKQVVKCSQERCLPTAKGKGHPYHQRHRGSMNNLNKQVLLNFFQFITLTSYSLLLLLLSHFSRVRLCVTPWTAAHQAPPSMGFSRQEYWSGVSLPSQSYSLTYYISTWLPIFIKPRIKIQRSDCFFGSVFPYEGSQDRYIL